MLLTLLGGGAFGNRSERILDAIRRAVASIGVVELDISVVSYAEPDPELVRFVATL